MKLNATGKVILTSSGAVSLCCCDDVNPIDWIFARKLCAREDCSISGNLDNFIKINPSTIATGSTTWEDYLASLGLGSEECAILKIDTVCYIFGTLDSGPCQIGDSNCNESEITEYTGEVDAGGLQDPTEDCDRCHDCCEQGTYYDCTTEASYCFECGKTWRSNVEILGAYEHEMSAAYADYQHDVNGQCLPPDNIDSYGNARTFGEWDFTCEYESEDPGAPGTRYSEQIDCDLSSDQNSWNFNIILPYCEYTNSTYSEDCIATGFSSYAEGCSGVADWNNFTSEASSMISFLALDTTWVTTAVSNRCAGSHTTVVGGTHIYTEWSEYHTTATDVFVVYQEHTEYGTIDGVNTIHVGTKRLDLSVVVYRTIGPECEELDKCDPTEGGMLLG